MILAFTYLSIFVIIDFIVFMISGLEAQMQETSKDLYWFQ